MKVGIYGLLPHVFHVVIGLLDDYGAIQLSHYDFQCYTLQLTSYHNLHEVQIPNTPSSILINLFNFIKFLLYINIGFCLGFLQPSN
jgi:hypothetical protein